MVMYIQINIKLKKLLSLYNNNYIENFQAVLIFFKSISTQLDATN